MGKNIPVVIKYIITSLTDSDYFLLVGLFTKWHLNSWVVNQPTR